MTQSENENDHFDLDHFDHNLPHPSSSHIALMLLLCYSYLKWGLYGICIGVVYALLQRHFLIVYLAFRFRFATSAVSVDAFKYYVQNKHFFCIFLTFSKKIFLPLHPRKQKPMSVIVVSPL